MKISLEISVETTGRELGTPLASEARICLANYMRRWADFVEKTDDPAYQATFIDEDTHRPFGKLVLKISEVTP